MPKPRTPAPRPVPPARRIGVFLLIAAAIYAAGLLLWPALDAPLTRAAAGVSNFTLNGALGSTAAVRIDTSPGDQGTMALFVVNRTTGEGLESRAGVRFLLWRPIVLLAALVLATPVALSDRLGSLALALPILLLLALLRIWLHAIELALDLNALTPPRAVELPLRFFADVARTGAANLLLEPLLLWGLITLLPARARLRALLRNERPPAG